MNALIVYNLAMPATLFPDLSLPASSAAGKAAVVRGLIHGLLQGDCRGGDRVTEEQAAEQFGVSRTPVREALLELAGLGIIDLRRNCGALFRPLGPEELRELYSVRTLLEVEAARLAAGRMPDGLLRNLESVFARLAESGDEDPDWQHDRTLHAAIATASGNRRLADEIARYGHLVQTVRQCVGRQSHRVHRITAMEHLRIIRALASGDPSSSAEAMRAHLTQAAESAAAVVATLQDRARHDESPAAS